MTTSTVCESWFIYPLTRVLFTTTHGLLNFFSTFYVKKKCFFISYLRWALQGHYDPLVIWVLHLKDDFNRDCIFKWSYGYYSSPAWILNGFKSRTIACLHHTPCTWDISTWSKFSTHIGFVYHFIYTFLYVDISVLDMKVSTCSKSMASFM